MYETILKQVRSLTEDNSDFISNAANTASLLFSELPQVNWAGFYMLNGDHLLLGPFSGKTACIGIELGKGVCGNSAQQRKTIIVPDVDKFPGHIVCDADARSEIVLPMISGGELFGVLDIDSPVYGRFTESDQSPLEAIVEILMKNSDLQKLKNYYLI